MNMKEKIIGFSFCVCLLLAFIQVRAAAPLFQVMNNDTQAIHVPLLWDEKIKIPIVEVKIGDETLRLALDTGADQVTLAIEPDSVKRLTVNFLENREHSMDVYGEKYEARSFIIPSVRIGDLQFTKMKANEELRVCAVNDDGIIGNQVLANFHVYLDYQDSEMILYPNTTTPDCLNSGDWIKIPFVREKIGIIILGNLPGISKTMRFCLDTGAFCDINGKSMGMIRSQSVKGIELKEAEQYQYFTTDGFKVGNVNLGSMDFLAYPFEQPEVDGFLGHNLLKDYKVIIDFTDDFLYLKRFSKK